MRSWTTAVSILCVALAGCAGAPPERTDPFSNLGSDTAVTPLKDVSVAVVLSDNTRKSVAYARGLPKGGSAFDPDMVYQDIAGVFADTFRSASKAQTLAEARKTGADLTVLLDIYTDLGNPKGLTGTVKIDVDAIFLAADGSQMEDVKASVVDPVRMFASNYPVVTTIQEADKQAQARLKAGLIGSTKLIDYAKSKPGGASGAAAAAPPAFVRSSDVDSPRFRLSERADDFALVIGVEKYSNDLPDARFAERDAAATKDALIALGYPERNIKFLTGNRASLSALSAYIEDWLPRNVKEDSQVFFYFSGHGAPDVASNQAYLVPSDGNPNFLEKTAYPVGRLYANLGALKAKRVIAALDSCFSGAGGRSVLASGARPLVTRVKTSLAPGGKISLFTASGPAEITSTLDDQGHGIFTYYFLKGLEGAARDSSGAVTPDGLYQYLKPKVQDAASRQNRDQTPVLSGELGGALTRFP